MMTQFIPLFTLGFTHPYYTADCQDFDFVLARSTAETMKDGKLLAKVLRGKLVLLFEADAAKAPLLTMTGTTLRIGLRLVNPWFGNVTDFNLGFGPSKPLYRNLTAPASLNPALPVTLVGDIFSHALSNASRPVTVILKDAASQNRTIETITSAADRPVISFDLTGGTAGLYSVEEVYTASSVSKNYYADPEFQGQGIFGIVEIKIDAGFYTAAPNFKIVFTAKQEPLKYYLVAKNYSPADFNMLSISDQGFGEEGRTEITFTKVASGSFTNAEIPLALLNEGGAQVVLFKSATIDRSEKPRRKIQLRKTTDVLITHLPQPGAEKPNSDLIIHVAKP
jgi:hypothetical protein